MLSQQLTEQQLDELFAWVDSIPLSRPKKNISRDYSDALLMAETINHFYPKLVELHNYPATNSVKNKASNWKTLNSKALSKLGLNLKSQQIQKLASAAPNYIQCLLHELKKICDSDGLYTERPVQKSQNPKLFNNYQQNSYNHNQDNSHEQDEQDESKIRKGLKNSPLINNTLNNNAMGDVKISKIEQLKQILKLIKDKISMTEKTIKRKDAQIKQLQDIIHLGV